MNPFTMLIDVCKANMPINDKDYAEVRGKCNEWWQTIRTDDDISDDAKSDWKVKLKRHCSEWWGGFAIMVGYFLVSYWLKKLFIDLNNMEKIENEEYN